MESQVIFSVMSTEDGETSVLATFTGRGDANRYADLYKQKFPYCSLTIVMNVLNPVIGDLFDTCDQYHY